MYKLSTNTRLLKPASLIPRLCRSSHQNSRQNAKVTIPKLHKMHKEGTPITMLTAHDAISGRMADQAGVDMILVGDSLSMVSLGFEDTCEIELDDMIHHARAVSRGVENAFIIGDLPFGTFGKTPEQTFDSAVAMIRKGKAHGVKMEGGQELVSSIKKLTSMGIAVCGHIGLTPQRASSIGGFKVQGKTAKTAMSVLEDALAVQEAGCFATVLEAVPDRVGELITKKLSIPTIGIGAGPKTSGQVLVQLDMLGGFTDFQPRFVKHYSNYFEENVRAISEYQSEVKSRQFPAKEHVYKISDQEYEKFESMIDSY